MQKLREQASALEGQVSTIEVDIAQFQRDVKYNVHLTAQHAARLDDIENRLRRNNVHDIGIPERAECKNPVAFIEQWLLSVFGKDSFSHMFTVQRAHRVPAHPLPPGNSLRFFLFKLLNHKDRDVILSKARNLSSTLVIDNSKVSLFTDFSAELQKQHAKFQDIKK